MKTVLSIAGSDSCGGAGIQADIKTCCAFNVFSTTAITALTAQNTSGIQGISLTSPDFIKAQIDAVADDIYPDAVKVGMLGSPEIVRTVAECIKRLGFRNVVVDPVLVASSGHSLSGDVNDTAGAILEYLAPLATVITPNYREAIRLAGVEESFEDPAPLALRLLAMTDAEAVLLKGGDIETDESIDYLVFRKADKLEIRNFALPRIETPNNHGTGCTLSSAIACSLATGLELEDAVWRAKNFVTAALRSGKSIKLGKGTGPLDFFVKE